MKITVKQGFGSQDLIEIYSDYVAKKIRDMVRREDGQKKEENNSKK